MKGKMVKYTVMFCITLFGMGCAAAPQFKPGPFTAHQFDLDQYASKVNTALIVFDASKSMTKWPYKGTPKINIAKDVVHRMNQTIPDIEMESGLRVFGQNPEVASGDTALIYGITDYSQSGLDSALNAIQGHGMETPMSAAVEAAGNDLAATSGPIALILVSDGEHPEIPNLPVDKNIKALKDQYGARLCIYTIGIGDNPEGITRMKEIARTGGCGFFKTADDLTSAAAMADFVEEVFLTKLRDSDGDGVYDKDDMCPGTPPGVEVDERGCPLEAPKPKAAAPADSDGDGVMDDRDKCPNTPVGAEVDADGCWITGNVHFDFDKSNIKTRFEPILIKIAAVMKQNPELQLTINGHTDSIGTESYNQGLSERRAQSAKQYLKDRGIDGSRLSIVGHSFRQPIATNETSEGRAENRRAEFEPVR
ncbi:MAG: OmpA family protein [Thermodesulfobacteriota bacterium]